MDRLNSRSDGGSASLFLKNQIVNIHFQATLSPLPLLSRAGVMHEAPQMVCKQMGHCVPMTLHVQKQVAIICWLLGYIH